MSGLDSGEIEMQQIRVLGVWDKYILLSTNNLKYLLHELVIMKSRNVNVYD